MARWANMRTCCFRSTHWHLGACWKYPRFHLRIGYCIRTESTARVGVLCTSSNILHEKLVCLDALKLFRVGFE